MIITDKSGEGGRALGNALAGTDYITRLERRLGAATGKHAVAVCSTDAAIHTALHILGVRDGDYVFVPSYTFYSYIAPVAALGAVPVFLDCDPSTRCVSPSALETAFVWADLQSKPPKAVIIDNAFGSVADYDSLIPLCKAWNTPVIELCVWALGGDYKGKPLGANGDVGVIGFDRRYFGGGGIVLCGDEPDTARKFARYAYSDGESHDYRLNNFVAALDCARLDINGTLTDRARSTVTCLCAALDCVLAPVAGDSGAFALVKAGNKLPDIIARGYDVKTPPPVHTLPKYRDCKFFEHEQGYSVCQSLGEYCLISTDISLLSRYRLISMLKSR